MYVDSLLKFGDEQAVTAAAASTNVIPLSAVRDIGNGRDLYLVLLVTETMADSGSDSTLAVTLETDSTAAFSSAATVTTFITLAALTAAGTKYVFKLPPENSVAYEEFIRLYFTPANGNLSAGKFTTFLTADVENTKDYAGNFTVA